ncbi:L-2-hydroxyglutarate oxidase [Allonocardiopsis opalescens]|uniref:Malate dehydrogenase (Quinone)/L-2-hydroxyglutarate oxidase n=1 Tax=Allonocardiopsis opalescens TaxID=1144618 RepID=A0A2T0Q2L4_9ACTN|nr:L-2-hydroxyglutarate oxidase [Allonocardiopsis opalescens]PRX98031.1 malate dehydrogenase (quinone)/L-2-hydroxyglutarate oxidase [Allonocardiopsis opalescens]
MTPPSVADTVDVAVVGGGIVGLAAARALLRARPGLRLCLLEREQGWGRHQTGHNSGVIHSGLYYAPGSLKARLTREGLREMYAFCAEQGLPAERCGKVVVASDASELPRLEALYERGRANGVRVERLTRAQLRAREPHIAGAAALLVPETGITDYGAVAERIAALLAEDGADLRLGTTVQGIETHGEAALVATDRGTLRARQVVTAAGLHSDLLVRASGAAPKAAIVPFRGEYFHLRPERTDLVRHLVYPVPDPAFPFLGVHLTRSVDGGVHAGPSAVLALSRHGYRRRDVSARTLRELAASRGLRLLARRYWRAGLAEMARSAAKPLFVRGVRRLLPEVRGRDLVRAEAGVRAQALTPDGALVDDFLFQREGRCLHVVNAPSPAATASFAIGRAIAERALSEIA